MHTIPSALPAPPFQAPERLRRGVCDAAITLISREKNVPVRLLRHRSRGRAKAARARQLAMYLSHVILGRSLAEIADAFGRDRSTVSYACALIEDLRDDLVFDEEIQQLERRLEALQEGGFDGAH